jgi:hypothetical protein
MRPILFGLAIGLLCNLAFDAIGSPVLGSQVALALATLGFLALSIALGARPRGATRHTPLALVTSSALLGWIATAAPAAPLVTLAIVLGGVTAFVDLVAAHVKG